MWQIGHWPAGGISSFLITGQLQLACLMLQRSDSWAKNYLSTVSEDVHIQASILPIRQCSSPPLMRTNLSFLTGWGTGTLHTRHSIRHLINLRCFSTVQPAHMRPAAMSRAALLESQIGLAGVMDCEVTQSVQPAAQVEPPSNSSEPQTQGKAKRKLALHVAYCGTGFKGQSRSLLSTLVHMMASSA